MKKFSLIVTVLLFLLIGINEAFACSCLPRGILDSIKDSDAVFVGKVIEVVEEKKKWKLEISSVIKGNLFESAELGASMVGTSCEISSFKLNESYLIFATESDSIFYTKPCSWSGNIEALKVKYTDKFSRDFLEKRKSTLTKEQYEKWQKDIEIVEKSFDEINKELLKLIEKAEKPKKIKTSS